MIHALTWQRAALAVVTLCTFALLLYTVGAPIGGGHG